jgi:hypothetical protein
MQARVVFKGQHWFHINFWARSRSSNKIKRFFAELHYKPLITISGFVSWEQLLPDPLPAPVAIVETCTIIGKHRYITCFSLSVCGCVFLFFFPD